MIGFVGYYFIFKNAAGKKSNYETGDNATSISTNNLDSTNKDLELSEFTGNKSKHIEAMGGNETAVVNIDYENGSGKVSPLLIANTSLTESYV